MTETDILTIENLTVHFQTDYGVVQAVREVSLSLKKGEVLAIVGESGCGKSALCKSIMQLLPANAQIVAGSISVADTELTCVKEKDMCKLRGKLFSMIFQDPMSSLNPTMTIGEQIAEAVAIHHKSLSKEALRNRVFELMELVGIEQPRERARLYPFNFSGGMRQRVVLAIALAGNPSILLADEPTTALDVTIQAQMLDLLRSIQEQLGTSTILVTHDMGVVARVADRVAIMYAGKIVEIGTAEDIFYDARHPYTKALLRSLPAKNLGKEELYTIPGMPPALIDPPKGDAFACRNEEALPIDFACQPPMFTISKTHQAATWTLDPAACEAYASRKELP